MTPAQMDAVVAYDNVHGVGLDRLTEIVARGLSLLIAQWSGDNKTEPGDIRQDIDPWYQG